ncbi:MAG: hypothetical protein IIB36_09200, partial [Gemmatimonadetes bacterium]|nr:hypothetical protein [Gemmatimonadota bacterium]
DYFDAMMSQLDAGGAGNLLYTLLEREINLERLKHPPTTPALEQQAAESLAGEELWLHNLLATGEIEGSVDGAGRCSVAVAVLYASYRESLSSRDYSMNVEAFAGFVRDRLQGKAMGRCRVTTSLHKQGIRSTTYKLPPLAELRAAYSQRGRGASQEWDETDAWISVNDWEDPVETSADERPEASAEATHGESDVSR